MEERRNAVYYTNLRYVDGQLDLPELGGVGKKMDRHKITCTDYSDGRLGTDS